ncbi:MAG: AraC family transcriptional regulator [Phaeodactylibacter sp.]|nr:AraC family transcriptional regulator [Phaeodactylibacter sp.]MCB9273988.1 AraC family transcriptional regulator [Lewinellaceae bacterium]
MPSANKWLSRLNQIIQENIADGGLDNAGLAARLGVSERHLFRRVKEHTGLSPQHYIRQRRLHQARLYLESGTCRTVKETAAAVGYVSTSYFISLFEKEFGKRPLEVLQEWGWR